MSLSPAVLLPVEFIAVHASENLSEEFANRVAAADPAALSAALLADSRCLGLTLDSTVIAKSPSTAKSQHSSHKRAKQETLGFDDVARHASSAANTAVCNALVRLLGTGALEFASCPGPVDLEVAKESTNASLIPGFSVVKIKASLIVRLVHSAVIDEQYADLDSEAVDAELRTVMQAASALPSDGMLASAAAGQNRARTSASRPVPSRKSTSRSSAAVIRQTYHSVLDVIDSMAPDNVSTSALDPRVAALDLKAWNKAAAVTSQPTEHGGSSIIDIDGLTDGAGAGAASSSSSSSAAGVVPAKEPASLRGYQRQAIHWMLTREPEVRGDPVGARAAEPSSGVAMAAGEAVAGGGTIVSKHAAAVASFIGMALPTNAADNAAAAGAGHADESTSVIDLTSPDASAAAHSGSGAGASALEWPAQASTSSSSSSAAAPQAVVLHSQTPHTSMSIGVHCHPLWERTHNIFLVRNDRNGDRSPRSSASASGSSSSSAAGAGGSRSSSDVTVFGGLEVKRPCCAYYCNSMTGYIVRQACAACSPGNTRNGEADSSALSLASSQSFAGAASTASAASLSLSTLGIRHSGVSYDGVPRGGMLCDQPGLGKTLECIGVIAAHPLTSQPFSRREAGAGAAASSAHASSSAAVSGTDALQSALRPHRQAGSEDCMRLEQHLDSLKAVSATYLRKFGLHVADSITSSNSTQPERSLFVSRATLVVMPGALVDAVWKEEVASWCPSLSVVTYEGVTKLLSGYTKKQASGASRASWTMPRDRSPNIKWAPLDEDTDVDGESSEEVRRVRSVCLAELTCADIVITTFEVLQQDVNNTGEGRASGAGLRRGKRYPALKSPLLDCHFHRIILDEAQYIESRTMSATNPSSASASSSSGASTSASTSATLPKRTEMALRLRGTYLWCVSGTPLDAPEDVRAVLKFLRHRPFGRDYWWSKVLHPLLAACRKGQKQALLNGDADESDADSRDTLASTVTATSTALNHGGGTTDGGAASSSSSSAKSLSAVNPLTPRPQSGAKRHRSPYRRSSEGGGGISESKGDDDDDEYDSDDGAGAGSSSFRGASSSTLATPSRISTPSVLSHPVASRLGDGYTLLAAILRPILWRNTKERLEQSGELWLPPVTEFVVVVRQGAIEEQFYRTLRESQQESLIPALQLAIAGAALPTSSAETTAPNAAPEPHSTVDDVDVGAGAGSSSTSSAAKEPSAAASSESADGTLVTATKKRVRHQKVESNEERLSRLLQRASAAIMDLRRACMHVQTADRAAAKLGIELPSSNVGSSLSDTFKILLLRDEVRHDDAKRGYFRSIVMLGSLAEYRAEMLNRSSAASSGVFGSGSLGYGAGAGAGASKRQPGHTAKKRVRFGAASDDENDDADTDQQSASNSAMTMTTPVASTRASLIAEARKWYEDGWHLSDQHVINREEFREEIAAMRRWKSLDIAALSGIARMAEALGDHAAAKTARHSISESVVAPMISSKLRLQLFYSMQVLREVLAGLSKPLSEWFELPDSAHPELIQLCDEFATRTKGMRFPMEAGDLSSPVNGAIIPSNEVVVVDAHAGAGAGAAAGSASSSSASAASSSAPTSQRLPLRLHCTGDEDEQRWAMLQERVISTADLGPSSSFDHDCVARGEEQWLLEKVKSMQGEGNGNTNAIGGLSSLLCLASTSSAAATASSSSSSAALSTHLLRIRPDDTDSGIMCPIFLLKCENLIKALRPVMTAVQDYHKYRQRDELAFAGELVVNGLSASTASAVKIRERKWDCHVQLRKKLVSVRKQEEAGVPDKSKNSGVGGVLGGLSGGATALRVDGDSSETAPSRSHVERTVCTMIEQRPTDSGNPALYPFGTGDPMRMYRQWANEYRNLCQTSASHRSVLYDSKLWIWKYRGLPEALDTTGRGGFGRKPSPWTTERLRHLWPDIMEQINILDRNIIECSRMAGEIQGREEDVLSTWLDMSASQERLPLPFESEVEQRDADDGDGGSAAPDVIDLVTPSSAATVPEARLDALKSKLLADTEQQKAALSTLQSALRFKRTMQLLVEEQERKEKQGPSAGAAAADGDVQIIGAPAAGEAGDGARGSGIISSGGSSGSSAMEPASWAIAKPTGTGDVMVMATTGAGAVSSSSPGAPLPAGAHREETSATPGTGPGAAAPTAEPAPSQTAVPAAAGSRGDAEDDDDVESRLLCLICRVKPDLLEAVLLPCGHIQCSGCMDQWKRTSHKLECTGCRLQVVPTQLFTIDPRTMGRELSIQRLDNFLSGSMRQPRMGASSAAATDVDKADDSAATASDIADPSVSSTAAVNSVELNGQFTEYGTRIATVCRRLKKLPFAEKAVVVSTWKKMLELTCKALGNEAIRAVVLEGNPFERGEVVRRFMLDPTVQVLLLHATADCSGLTLIAANHLMLLDPVVSSATMAQLIGRISRQGQARNCYVYHFLAQNTIEDGLLRLRTHNIDPSSSSGRDSAGAGASSSSAAAGAVSVHHQRHHHHQDGEDLGLSEMLRLLQPASWA